MFLLFFSYNLLQIGAQDFISDAPKFGNSFGSLCDGIGRVFLRF